MFDERSSTYDGSEMHRWLAQRSVSGLAIRPRSMVLDAAAGTGLASRVLFAEHPSLVCIAVDLSAALLTTARRSGTHAVRGDVERLPIRDAVVDWVVCVSAAAYFPHPEVALAEFGRVLRPGGGVAVQAWAADGLAPTRSLRAAVADLGVVLRDPNAALGSRELLAGALANAGLSNIAVTVDTWRQPWVSPDHAWSATAASPLGDALPNHLKPAIRRRFEDLWAAARAASPEYDAQPALIATAIKASSGAPVVPPKNHR